MITAPISKSVSRSIALAINDPDGAGFDPLSLFAAGEQGAWYDPSDLSTLFQDAAGTIPVTAAGQPVGRMLDKSGRGNHATQATATSRPILQTSGGKRYLVFDGVDDWMVTGVIDLSASNKATIWAGMLKASDAASGTLCEFSPDTNSNNGSFVIRVPFAAAGANYGYTSKGTTAAVTQRAGFAAPHTAVMCAQSDISAPSVLLRVNTTTAAAITTSQGSGNYGVFPMYIGRRGGTSGSFNGSLYGLIVRAAASSALQVTYTETYMNNKTGAY